MQHSTVATQLGWHHDDRRKNGNASKAGSDGTGSITIMGGSSGLVDAVIVGTVIVGMVDCLSFTIGSSRNSSVPAEVGDRGDRGEEGTSGTVRKSLQSLVSCLFSGDSGSTSDSALDGFWP